MKKFLLAIVLILSFQMIGSAQPLDGITPKTILKERKVLPYPPIREADILWEKRIWRVIDVREKMNKPFAYPEKPFIQILLNAAIQEQLTVYSTEDDKFTMPMSIEDLEAELYRTDTIMVIDPITYEDVLTVVKNDLDLSSIKRYRVKEVWYFDEAYSTLRVRILGIAPLMDVTDDNGNFRYEKPMFWVYYPQARNILAQQEVFNPANEASTMSWEDLMEMRYFSSYIYKESNIHDRRLEDYVTGVDLLLESEKIKMEIFNYEQDLWSY